MAANQKQKKSAVQQTRRRVSKKVKVAENHTAGAPKKAASAAQKQSSKKKAAPKQNVKSAPKKNTARKKNTKALPSKAPKKINISFLGGLGEIGKNLTVYEYDGEMIIVDCGLAFPDSNMHGVDAVIPDFTYLKENAAHIKAMFITHGHEDHIGAVAYLMKEINVPIYGTALTIGLIEIKLREHGILNTCTLKKFRAGDTIKVSKFSVECIHVNHSIPDAVAFAIRTGAGTIVQTGDFKIDTTPIDGEVIDLPRLSQLGKEGVLALLQDSTNAEKEGYTFSESMVGGTFEALFREAGRRRIIVATFASNVHRIQQIMDVAKALKRKVAVMGRSMSNIVALGEELGYLKVPKGLLVTKEEIKNFPDHKLVLICTGSQGEPMAALSKMALSEHRQVEITANDYIIISSRPIPGNERGVGNVINGLIQHGAEVIYENMYQTHVSGHACAEELKMMISLVKPKLFIPVHGEQKHLKKHAALAGKMGYTNKQILIPENGTKYTINAKGRVEANEKIPAGVTFIDSSGYGDVESIVLRDRSKLSSAGMISVAAAVDMHSRFLLAGPEVVSRGFVYMKENEALITAIEKRSEEVIEDFLRSRNYDANALRSRLADEISKLIYRQTKRNPMILPTIMEV
ncbi:MAG: RNase J family beta-CASP ribonuclease [Clostridia bacterium]|nr:RNase J family beta-CASP ribonuclease [Clostridia bacterium]